MSDANWGSHLLAHLIDAGVAKPEAERLTTDALEVAAEADASPRSMYGPALPYARTIARTVRQSTATAAPLHRERGKLVLRLRGVTKRYGRRKVLSEVDLDLHAGEVAAIVGANGSGKSTLLNICAGLTKASSGTVQRTSQVGYAPQHNGVASMLTPHEHFELFGAVYGMSHKKAMATGSHLAAQLGWQPKKGVVASRLSGGTQQKLNVVLSELNRPDLILLDEPYQGFDQDSYIDFWEQVFRWRDGGTGVLVVTHMLHELERVDQVLELEAAGDS